MARISVQLQLGSTRTAACGSQSYSHSQLGTHNGSCRSNACKAKRLQPLPVWEIQGLVYFWFVQDPISCGVSFAASYSLRPYRSPEPGVFGRSTKFLEAVHPQRSSSPGWPGLSPTWGSLTGPPYQMDNKAASLWNTGSME